MNRRHVPMAPLLALGLAGVLAGCSPYTIQRDWDPDVRFDGYKTFALYAQPPSDPKGGPQAAVRDQLYHRRVQAAITQTLKTMGYTYSARSPQLMIGYHMGAEERVRVEHDPGYGGYHWQRPYPTARVYTYTAGTLTLTIVDKTNNRVVWEAHGETSMSKSATPEERERKIQEIIQEMLEDFPPED